MHPKTQIKVAALVLYPPETVPGQRYRLEQWMPELAAQGITVELFPFVDQELMRLLYQPGKYVAKAAAFARCLLRVGKTLAQLRAYDAIYLFRAACLAGPAFLEKLLPLFRRPVVFDFDDAIFYLHTSQANRYLGWLKFPGKTASICRLSQHVVVGNHYLADYARQFNEAVSVIPSSVDTEMYQPQGGRATTSRIIVGWTGSSTSQTYLEAFAPMLRELMARYPIELRVHSDREPDLPGVPYIWRKWSAETEVEEIRQFHIGLMPMPDEEWAKGKCAMKALLYMSLGIPAVCSAVGANCEVIQHGENGMLAATTAEWLGALGALIEDAALRSRLGTAGRRTIEERYSKAHAASLFADVVRSTVRDWQQKQEVKQWQLLKSKNSGQ